MKDSHAQIETGKAGRPTTDILTTDNLRRLRLHIIRDGLNARRELRSDWNHKNPTSYSSGLYWGIRRHSIQMLKIIRILTRKRPTLTPTQHNQYPHGRWITK